MLPPPNSIERLCLARPFESCSTIDSGSSRLECGLPTRLGPARFVETAACHADASPPRSPPPPFFRSFAGAAAAPPRALRAPPDAHPGQRRGRALPGAGLAGVCRPEDGAAVSVGRRCVGCKLGERTNSFFPPSFTHGVKKDQRRRTDGHARISRRGPRVCLKSMQTRFLPTFPAVNEISFPRSSTVFRTIVRLVSWFFPLTRQDMT